MFQAVCRRAFGVLGAAVLLASLTAGGCSRPQAQDDAQPRQDAQPRPDVQPHSDAQPREDTQPRGEGEPHTEAALRDVEATVRRFPIDSDTFVLVVDSEPDTRYLPDELPAPLQDDGLHVVFDATLAPVPPNVRLVGTPIKLVRIRVRDGKPRS